MWNIAEGGQARRVKRARVHGCECTKKKSTRQTLWRGIPWDLQGYATIYAPHHPTWIRIYLITRGKNCKCSRCGSGFIGNGDLNVHLLNHSGIIHLNVMFVGRASVGGETSTIISVFTITPRIIAVSATTMQFTKPAWIVILLLIPKNRPSNANFVHTD